MTGAPTVSAAELAAVYRACELAARGAGTVLPNPVVGCVIVSPDGDVVGEGFHAQVGGPHAEVAALSAAATRARGATAVVTLEPCNHTGRTGPCSEALIAAGIARVVVAVRDPWPPAAGGMARLAEAGVEVVDLGAPLEFPSGSGTGDAAVTGDPAAAGSPNGAGVRGIEDAVAAAEDVNRVWLTASRRRRPFVTLKIASTLDGRVAAADGTSRWISSPASRADAHEMRRRIDCIAVGVGTVLADDPQLTARDAAGEVTGRQPLRVVVDSHGRTPATARVLDDAAATLVATAERFGTGADGRVDLDSLLAALYRDGRRHLLVEGGPRLAASFLGAGLVDEVLVYLAPLLLGAGRSAVEGGGVTTLTDAYRAQLVTVDRCGPDLRLRYRLPS